MRFNTGNNRINDSENYRKFYQEAPGDETAKIGWQLSVILALVVSVCERNEFKQTRTFNRDSQANRLLQAEQLSMSEEEFKLGAGILSKAEPPQETAIEEG